MAKKTNRLVLGVVLVVTGLAVVRSCGTAAKGANSGGQTININGEPAGKLIEETVQQKIEESDVAAQVQDRMAQIFEDDSTRLQEMLQQEVQNLVCIRANSLLTQWEQQNEQDGISVIRFMLDKQDRIQHEASLESRGIEQYSASAEQFGMARDRIIDAAAVQTALNAARSGKTRLECDPITPQVWATVEAYVVDSYRVVQPSATAIAEAVKEEEASE